MQLVLVVLACAACVAQAQNFPGAFGFGGYHNPVYAHQRLLAGLGGHAVHTDPHHDDKKGLKLSCVGIGGHQGSMMTAMIKMREDHDDHHATGLGHAVHSPLGYLGNPLARLAQLRYGHTVHEEDSKLEASFFLKSPAMQGKYKLIVTERAFSDEGCLPENFGPGLKVDEHDSGFSHIGHAPVVHGGLGLGGFHGGLAGLGFAGPHAFFGRHEDPKKHHHHGVIAEITLEPGVPRQVSLDKVKKFTKLEQLAGRGLIACDDVDEDFHGKAECVGDIPLCCAFVYDKDSKHH